MLLQARNVTKRFGGLVANNNVSMDVKAGEVHALIGPNGAGKSTFFNMISGVDDATDPRAARRRAISSDSNGTSDDAAC
ncbi:putative ABC transporter ATP-binding protein YbhF [compost metagenome]